MSEEQKKQLEQQLWNIANDLRGKMNADEFKERCMNMIKNKKKILIKTSKFDVQIWAFFH